jgi:diamine N-acetyltransferase
VSPVRSRLRPISKLRTREGSQLFLLLIGIYSDAAGAAITSPFGHAYIDDFLRMSIQKNEMVNLKPISADNWRECADLPVSEVQRSFLPANVFSIAAAQFYPNSVCRAIYAENEMVGFAMYGPEQGTNRIKIFRLMIAAPFQRRGLGTAAMKALLVEVTDRWQPDSVYVSFQDGNPVARHLYARLGFQELEREGFKVTARKMMSAK